MAGSCYKFGNVLYCMEVLLQKPGIFFTMDLHVTAHMQLRKFSSYNKIDFDWVRILARNFLFPYRHENVNLLCTSVCSRKINVDLNVLPKAMFAKIKFQDTQRRDMQFFALNATILTAKGNLRLEFRKNSLSLMVYLRKLSKTRTTRGLQLVADLENKLNHTAINKRNIQLC